VLYTDTLDQATAWRDKYDESAKDLVSANVVGRLWCKLQSLGSRA